MAERRPDPTNPPGSKKAYTRQQFVDFYGADHAKAMWRKAGRMLAAEPAAKGQAGGRGKKNAKKVTQQDAAGWKHLDPVVQEMYKQMPEQPEKPPPKNREERVAQTLEAEKEMLPMLDMMMDDAHEEGSVKVDLYEAGEGGPPVTTRVYRPSKQDGPLPMLVECHGGGMALLEGTEKLFTASYNYMASRGAILVCPQFTNCTKEPFPRGLDDCYGTLKWAIAQREKLKASDKIVVTGASGGGNLSLACAIRAKKEGLEGLKGCYSIIPYIYGLYTSARAARDCPSMAENHKIGGMDMKTNHMAKMYHEDHNPRDPLCWPYWAKPADLKGLVPVHVVVNQCDPLRDEGVAIYRKLLKAGVEATCQMNMGMPHAASNKPPHLMRAFRAGGEHIISWANAC